jgi:hypothetical protein
VVTHDDHTAPNSKSLRKVVVTGPLLASPLFPCSPAVTSTTLDGSIPWYSTTRTSDLKAGEVKLTVTRLVPAVAAATFAA